MNPKKILQKAVRHSRHKKELERMSKADAEKLLQSLTLSDKKEEK